MTFTPERFIISFAADGWYWSETYPHEPKVDPDYYGPFETKEVASAMLEAHKESITS